MRRWPPNKYLTPAMHRALLVMRNEDEELVKSPGDAFSWVGLMRVHPSTMKSLLQLVLISGQLSDGPGACDRFHLNDDGRGCLDSADSVPRIVRAMRGEPQ